MGELGGSGVGGGNASFLASANEICLYENCSQLIVTGIDIVVAGGKYGT
jgi:hypothetical protein